jgi:hypothetical protein
LGNQFFGKQKESEFFMTTVKSTVSAMLMIVVMNTMKKSSYLALVASAVLLMAAGPAGAAMLGWDFEPPTYTNGNLAGQDGWTAVSGTPTVTSTAPLAGLQSALLDSEGESVTHSLASQTFLNNGTEFSFLTKGTADSQGILELLDTSNTPYLAVATRFGANITVKSGANQLSLGTFNIGDVYKITLSFDFPNDTFSVTAMNLSAVQELTAYSGVAFAYSSLETTTSAQGQLKIRGYSYGGAFAATYDNLQFAVPEPLTLGLLGGSMALLLLRRRETR